MNNFKRVLVASTILTLGGCSMVDSFSEVENLNAATAVGSPFTQSLAAEYRDYANAQLNEHFDYPDALHFARKGLAAAAGEVVLPEPIADWNLSETYAQELNGARGRLIVAYDRGARETAPALTAKVQAKFDCWIEFQEESWREADSIVCKKEFSDLMKELESGLGVPQPTQAAAETPAFDANVFNVDPAAPMAPENAMYLIFFNWNSAEVSAGAQSVLDSVSEEVKKTPPATVKVVGHADTSGPKDYNQRLALRRAKAAKAKLVERGIDPAIMALDAKGEEDLLVPTPDDVREPANRRVNISFE